MPQSGRAGLGWGTVPETWSKGSKGERKEMVIKMVRGSPDGGYTECKIRLLNHKDAGQSGKRWSTGP